MSRVSKILDLPTNGGEGQRISSVIDTAKWDHLIVQVTILEGSTQAVLLLGYSDELEEDEGRLKNPRYEEPIVPDVDRVETWSWHIKRPRGRYYQLEVVRSGRGAEIASAILHLRPERRVVSCDE